MTVDEFFCEVDREKYPDVKQRYRFEEGDGADTADIHDTSWDYDGWDIKPTAGLADERVIGVCFE